VRSRCEVTRGPLPPVTRRSMRSSLPGLPLVSKFRFDAFLDVLIFSSGYLSRAAGFMDFPWRRVPVLEWRESVKRNTIILASTGRHPNGHPSIGSPWALTTSVFPDAFSRFNPSPPWFGAIFGERANIVFEDPAPFGGASEGSRQTSSLQEKCLGYPFLRFLG